MTQANQIGLAYLQAHPRDAARVLETLQPASVAELLKSTPARLCAPVLRAMHPARAALCLERLDDAVLATQMDALGSQGTASVLRHLDERRRSVVLDQLPASKAMILRMLLAYPQDTVGAWMDPPFLSMPLDLTAIQALQRLQASDAASGGRIWVTDEQGHLRGQLALDVLLRAHGQFSLQRLMEPCRLSLPARASLLSVLDHVGWQELPTLPVLERGQRLAGTLDRLTLSRALQHSRGPALPEAREDILSTVTSSYWNVTSGILESLVTLLPLGGASHSRPGATHEP